MPDLKFRFSKYIADLFSRVGTLETTVGTPPPQETYLTLAALRAITGYDETTIYLVDENVSTYKYDSTETTADDGDQYIKPDNIDPADPGRYIKQTELARKTHTHSQYAEKMSSPAGNKFLVADAATGNTKEGTTGPADYADANHNHDGTYASSQELSALDTDVQVNAGAITNKMDKLSGITADDVGKLPSIKADGQLEKTIHNAANTPSDDQKSALNAATSPSGSNAFVTAQQLTDEINSAYNDKGDLACDTDPNYPAGQQGDRYYVSAAGHIGGASGKAVEIGDWIVCRTDNAGGTEASVGTNWYVIEGNQEKATQTDAETGSNDQKYLTPLKGYQGWLAWIQNKTVSALNTTSKFVVGAINELKAAVDSLGNNVNTNHLYVDKSGNNSTGNGTSEKPYLTITEAITHATSGNTIHVNAGTYTENITLPDGVHLLAPGATLIGSLAIGQGSSVHLFKHLSSADSQSMVTKSGTAVSYYKTVVSDGRGDTGSRATVTNVLNQTNDSILFVDIETLYVTTTGRGVRDFAASFGHIHFKIKDLYLAGDFCKGLDAAGGSSNLVGFIDHILEINAPSGTSAIAVAAGSSIEATINEITAATAYDVDAGGTMHLNCGKITGTKTGVNSFNSDVIEEGSTNLFYTTARSNNALIEYMPITLATPKQDLEPETDIDKKTIDFEGEIIAVYSECDNDNPPTDSNLIHDVNLNGTSIFGTDKLNIDVNEYSSRTSSVTPTLVTTSVSIGDVISVDRDQTGSTNTGQGDKVTIKFRRTS